MAKKAAKQAEEIGTSRELYNFLFEACNIIRGPVSQDAFKEYITPICDMYKKLYYAYHKQLLELLEFYGERH